MEPIETPKAAATFAVYCELGPERSLAKVGQMWGESGALNSRLHNKGKLTND